MKRSQQLSAADYHAIWELHGELAEWPIEDLDGAMMHLLERSTDLIHAAVPALVLFERDPAASDADLAAWRVGGAMMTRLEPWQQRIAAESATTGRTYTDHPMFAHAMSDVGCVRTLRRQQVVSDAVWYRSPHVAEALESIGLDHSMVSIIPVAPEREAILNYCRPWGDRPFTPREQALLHHIARPLRRLCWEHAEQQNRRRLAEPLTPRLREMLDLLLQGLDEQEIARRMYLSPASVHTYVRRIYAALNVHSRAELMARWIR